MQSALLTFYAKSSSFGRHYGQLEFQRSAARRTNHARDNLRHQMGQHAQAVGCGQRRPAGHLPEGMRDVSSVSPDGRQVLSGSSDKTLKL
jgi:hypothetical protein